MRRGDGSSQVSPKSASSLPFHLCCLAHPTHQRICAALDTLRSKAPCLELHGTTQRNGSIWLRKLWGFPLSRVEKKDHCYTRQCVCWWCSDCSHFLGCEHMMIMCHDFALSSAENFIPSGLIDRRKSMIWNEWTSLDWKIWVKGQLEFAFVSLPYASCLGGFWFKLMALALTGSGSQSAL